MSVFWFFGPFFDYFFYCPKFQKWNLQSKILYTQKYNIVRHWSFPQQIGFVRFFLCKVPIDGFKGIVHCKFPNLWAKGLCICTYLLWAKGLCIATILYEQRNCAMHSSFMIFWDFAMHSSFTSKGIVQKWHFSLIWAKGLCNAHFLYEQRDCLHSSFMSKGIVHCTVPLWAKGLFNAHFLYEQRDCALHISFMSKGIVQCTFPLWAKGLCIAHFLYKQRDCQCTVLHIFIEHTPQIFKKSTFPYTPIWVNLWSELLVPTMQTIRIFMSLWASFDFLVHFLIIFFIVQRDCAKMHISSKILDMSKGIQHCDIDPFLSKLDCAMHISFMSKGIVYCTVLHIFIEQTPNFQWLFHIPQYLYICDQELCSFQHQILEFSDKNWETYERLLIFWCIFCIISFMSKGIVKWNCIKFPWYEQKTTLYDIDFPHEKLDCALHISFLSKVYCVLHIYFMKKGILHCPQFQKWNFKKSLYKNTTLYDIYFLKKLDFSIFFKKVSIDGFTHFWSKIHPKFSKNRFSIYPNILYICDQNFMLVPTIKY